MKLSATYPLTNDIHSSSFSSKECDYCEIKGCTNEAAEIVNVVIPWKTDEPGKLYLCRKCKHEWE